jgi:hypothetical protein
MARRAAGFAEISLFLIELRKLFSQKMEKTLKLNMVTSKKNYHTDNAEVAEKTIGCKSREIIKYSFNKNSSIQQ